MTRNEEFEEVRSLRFPIDNRPLTSADDTLGATGPPPAFLPAEVARTAWQTPRTPRPRQARHTAPWCTLPPTTPGSRPGTPDSLSTAAVLLLERLSPLERAVLVLREMLGCDMARIAAAVGHPETTCRRLAATVTARTPTGIRPWPRRITGADRVARLLAAIVPALLGLGVTMRPRDTADGPGALFHDPHGTLLGALALDIVDNHIHTLHWLPAGQALKKTEEPT
ncbi:sigma factor-like helix-turn-helix DNA-binding protein [Streptomyces sp. NBC_00019]|uniref:sigma factor-like helix-turn-helix DNA-binding protein n=1 Tax=Streptomyces sp. NBC_00019 TaxID=2975623 RepID=UPI002F914EBC